jgi:hypothetical protein
MTDSVGLGVYAALPLFVASRAIPLTTPRCGAAAASHKAAMLALSLFRQISDKPSS